MAQSETPSRSVNFTSHPSISPFAVPCETYLSTQHQENVNYRYIATGALVFDPSTPPRILLIQRSVHDSMGGLWEIPGGGCSDEDPDILHGVVRELWEETGLAAAHVGPKVGKDSIFATRGGKIVCKFTFLVDAVKNVAGCLDVKLNPSEHQAYIWATREEVEARKAGKVELNFTTVEQVNVVLEAFKMRRQMDA